ncbi:MAG TPA: sensor histidine kinase, partial [Mycobacteriales bacterium]
ERRRIAGDLHDGVVQDLAGVAFSLGAAARNPARDPEDTATVREAAEQVRDGVRSLRSLLVEIYPPNLYDEGLEAALSDLLARLEPRGIETSLRVDAPLDKLDLDATQLIYRAAQEGVRNVVAHADAARVSIAVTAVKDCVVLEVSDDGRGLPGPDLPQRPGHLGLRALGGLAATMGASLTLSSTPGKGTVLALEMPTP